MTFLFDADKGDLSGYWSLEFILNRFYILSKNPLEAVSKIEIVGVQNSVSTQALTWFAGLGSLSVLAFASVISVYEKLLTGIADWRFFKLAIIRRFKVLRLLWIYPAFAAAFLIVSGFIFAKLGL